LTKTSPAVCHDCWSVVLGAPPKVIWIRLGNCAPSDVARVLRFRLDQVRSFLEDSDTAFLALG
jgi:predicted nuclease of predicted toxin-antitoxin system